MSFSAEGNTISSMDEKPTRSVFEIICGPALFLHKFYGLRSDNKCICYRNMIVLILHFGLLLGFAVFGMSFGNGSDRYFTFTSAWHLLNNICAVITVLYFFVKRNLLIDIRRKLAKVNISVDPGTININRRRAVTACFLFTCLSLVQIITSVVAFILQYLLVETMMRSEAGYEMTFFVLWSIQSSINILVVYPIITLYCMLYVSLCLVCCAYVESYTSVISELKTPVEDWDLLQQQRVDVASVVSLVDDFLSPVFFLWTLLFSANIPISLFELVNYSCSFSEKLFGVIDICGSAILLLILFIFPSKLYEESRTCIASVSRMITKQAVYLTIAINSDPPMLTAWKFFTVTRGTVLTIVSLIATYSILVYQMANLKERQKYCDTM